jgi:G3E family GTPase
VLTHHYFIETVVVCLDSINGELHIGSSPESVKQIAAADKVVITKTDISTQENTDNLRARVAQINPAARIFEAAAGIVSHSILTPEPGSTGLPPQRPPMAQPNGAGGSGHAAGVKNIAIQFDEPIDWLAFGIWLSMLLQKHGEKMLRVKGIVDVGEKGPIVLNGVQHIIHPPRHLEDWKDYEIRNSQIVFITRDIEPNRIMDSLMAFQNLIGAHPEIQEVNLDPFA